MPSFFFDILEGEERTIGDEPFEFANSDAARQEAQRVVGEMAADQLPDGENLAIAVIVRDEHGIEFYRAEFCFSTTRLDQPVSPLR